MSASNIKMNYQIQSEIIDIIKGAKQYCFIVSPYFQPWHQLIKVLELAAIEERRVFFLFRDDQQDNHDVRALNEHLGFDVFFIKNLHAKFYLNEREGLISSMNLYDYSKENNFEIAYKITSANESRELAKSVIMGEMLKTWVDCAMRGRYMAELEDDEFELGKPMKKSVRQSPVTENPRTRASAGANGQTDEAFCIRCGAAIAADLRKPLCQADYAVWSQFQNYDYAESYCHRCGKPSETTMGRPLCYDCFRTVSAARTM